MQDHTERGCRSYTPHFSEGIEPVCQFAAGIGRQADQCVPVPAADPAACSQSLTRTVCCWQLQTTSSRSYVSSAPAGLSKDEDAGRFHSTKKGNFHEIFNLTENERPLAGKVTMSP